MESEYLAWLKATPKDIFYEGGAFWSVYQGAVMPALPFPAYYKLNSKQAKSLLKLTNAWLLCYSSDPQDKETSWWYVVCDKFDPANLSGKTRQNIKRGRRECIVKEIGAEWLAMNGYQCYISAVTRYKGKSPVSQNQFRNLILNTLGGPFSYWGVFYRENLAGYCQCIIDEKQVATNVTKYDPQYLKHRSAYALIDELIKKYVVSQGMILSNGNRSIAHNTNYQDVLISLGFQKKYCKLNVVYNPLLKFGLSAFYPVLSSIKWLPGRYPFDKLAALVCLEKIRRESFAG
ncbi:MAG: hypothetical protein M0Z52_09340 [Actinomycetota bacterium]|nr:hypothetical protein [Actinomycetota bacterium]